MSTAELGLNVNKIFENVDGSPIKIGQCVEIKKLVDPETLSYIGVGDHDCIDDAVDEIIGQKGVVVYLEYDGGCGQVFPQEPMIGVKLDSGDEHAFWFEELTLSTPFSLWSRDGLDDPHGEYYQGDIKKIAMGDKSSTLVATLLPVLAKEIVGIMWLTSAKEHLRWLSRKLYKLSSDHDGVNQRRAQEPNGHMSDDELANAFFISESNVDLEAGKARILWLMKEIKQIEG